MQSVALSAPLQSFIAFWAHYKHTLFWLLMRDTGRTAAGGELLGTSTMTALVQIHAAMREWWDTSKDLLWNDAGIFHLLEDLDIHLQSTRKQITAFVD